MLPAGCKQRIAALVGARGYLDRPEDLAIYEYDGSIDKHRPDLVVFPRSTEEVSSIVKIGREFKVPLVGRGSGTGLSGGALAPTGVRPGTWRWRVRSRAADCPQPRDPAAFNSQPGNSANHAAGTTPTWPSAWSGESAREDAAARRQSPDPDAPRGADAWRSARGAGTWNPSARQRSRESHAHHADAWNSTRCGPLNAGAG